MTEVRRVLSKAARQLFISDLLACVTTTASIAIGGVIATLLATRIFGLGISGAADWLKVGAIAAGAAVVSAVAWAMIRRAPRLDVARQLDEAAGLRESISTALTVEQSTDPWAKVVVESARERAAGLDVARALPVRAPRQWPVPMSMALALGVLWFSVPNMDVFGAMKKKQAEDQARQEIIQVKAEVKQNDEKLEELLRKAGVELKKDESEASLAADQKPLSADDIRKAAMQRLTDIRDQLEQRKSGEQAARLESMKQMMRQLRQPGPGPLENLSRAMQKGDFAQAKEELEKLRQQMQSGSMSAEQKEQAAKQMEKLAEQLKQAAQNRESLEKKLAEAGLSKEEAKKAASDPEALKQAMEKLQNLSPEQKKQLEQQAKSQQQSRQQCENMGEGLMQMSQALKQQPGESGESGEQAGQQGAQQLSETLSDLEMLEQDMKELDAASAEARQQLAKMSQGMGQGEGQGELAYGENIGPWRAGETQGQFGAGSGGPGQSGGGRSPDGIEAPANIEKVRTPTKNAGGPIVASRLVYGEQIRGESQAEFADAVSSSAQAAAKALENSRVQKELEGPVKHYFGRLQEKARGGSDQPAPSQPAPAEPKK